MALADFLQRAGILGLLVFILVSGARKVWVWGFQLEEMRVDRDRWRDIALRSMGHANRSVDVAQNSMDVAKRGVELAEREQR
jgi:hypothetical protein